jgi:hypothetical protein
MQFTYLIIILFFISLITLIKLDKNEVQYVKSSIDNTDYLVRDMPDKQRSADMLATIKKNIKLLIDHIKQTPDLDKDMRDYTNQLDSKFKDCILNESDGSSSYTSYSVNKGEQIVFCLRNKIDNSHHDTNLVMYVALHEVSHIACPEYDHTPLFKKIFKYLTEEAIKINIYHKIDFHSTPIDYCGLMISDSIV